MRSHAGLTHHALRNPSRALQIWVIVRFVVIVPPCHTIMTHHVKARVCSNSSACDGTPVSRRLGLRVRLDGAISKYPLQFGLKAKVGSGCRAHGPNPNPNPSPSPDRNPNPEPKPNSTPTFNPNPNPKPNLNTNLNPIPNLNLNPNPNSNPNPNPNSNPNTSPIPNLNPTH